MKLNAIFLSNDLCELVEDSIESIVGTAFEFSNSTDSIVGNTFKFTIQNQLKHIVMYIRETVGYQNFMSGIKWKIVLHSNLARS